MESSANRGAQKLHAFRRAPDGPLRAGLKPGQAIPHERLASLFGCHKTYVQKLEAGERQPSLALALKLQGLGIADPEDWHRPGEREAA